MPIRRDKINRAFNETKPLAIAIGLDTLNITYNREKYTPKIERELREAMEDMTPGKMLSQMLSTILTGWDVVDVHPDDLDKPEEEQRLIPVELSPENLDGLLSVTALGKIVEAIAADQNPNLTTSVPSNDTF